MNKYGRLGFEKSLADLMMEGWKPLYRYRTDLVGYDPDVVEAILEYVYDHFDLVHIREVETATGRFEEVFVTSHCKDFMIRLKNAVQYIKDFDEEETE